MNNCDLIIMKIKVFDPIFMYSLSRNLIQQDEERICSVKWSISVEDLGTPIEIRIEIEVLASSIQRTDRQKENV